jgi:hypothetical protein
MAGKLQMGQKEMVRAKVMEMVKQGQKKLVDASVILKVSYRQAKRIFKRYLKKGDKGLIHGNYGKPSHNRIDPKIRESILNKYEDKYEGFGPTLAAEKLLEWDGLCVDHETLRRWLVAKGKWERKRKRCEYRQRRKRRERFGELVQFDGSHHDWFEGRRPGCCLMNMVDDATGITESFLVEQETTEAAMKLLWKWILQYGIPQAVYCDRKNAFVLTREPSIEEQLTGIKPQSPFELSCEKLGIEVLVAYSPQAKGRVERNHGVYQDRFVKELRLRRLSGIDEANRYLEADYLQKINAKFSRNPQNPEDAHVPLCKSNDFANVFCFEYIRVVSNDYVIQIEGKCFQILRSNKIKPKPGDKVIVRKWLDGTLHFFHKEKEFLVEEYTKMAKKEDAGSLSA